MYRNLQIIVLATALSKSAESNTMKGAKPPSSSDTFFTVSADCRKRIYTKHDSIHVLPGKLSRLMARKEVTANSQVKKVKKVEYVLSSTLRLAHENKEVDRKNEGVAATSSYVCVLTCNMTVAFYKTEAQKFHFATKSGSKKV